MRGDPRQVAHAVAVGVRERAWVDLVDGAPLPPGRLRHRGIVTGVACAALVAPSSAICVAGGRRAAVAGDSTAVKAAAMRSSASPACRVSLVFLAVGSAERRAAAAEAVRRPEARASRPRRSTPPPSRPTRTSAGEVPLASIRARGVPTAAAAITLGPPAAHTGAVGRRQTVQRIRQDVVACANSLPPSSAYSRPSAVASLRPTWTTWLSASTRPESALIART